jgi:hypothetical protein
MLASCPASMLNQISLKLGIPFDSFLSHLALVRLAEATSRGLSVMPGHVMIGLRSTLRVNHRFP